MKEMHGMRVARSFVVGVLATVVLALPAVVLADGRVALVVGNSTYAHIGRLPNPDNDARDMSAALRRLGFEVTTEYDADRVELTEALRAFTRQSAGADVSLVFYAGHGIEMDGVNYLVPVDARLERDVDVRFETVTVGDETLVAYAAAAGTTAADGRGRNSPYTAALLSHLETPLEIGLLFRRVRAQVLATTNGAQRSHEYHSLVGEHYLTRTLATGASVTVSAAVPADPASADPPRPDPPEIDLTELHIAALRELAEAGGPEAQTELGERYEHGRGVVQDYGEAVSWFRRAADQGHAAGQVALGYMYSTGRGVARDDTEAVRRNRATPARSTTSASVTATVSGWGRTTGKLCGGTAVRPRRDTPARRTASAGCTRPVAACHGTTPRPCGGIGVPRSRDTRSARPVSASCTVLVAGWSGTTRKRFDGTAVRPSRETCNRSTISAGCTRTVVAGGGIASKPSAGIVSPPSKATPTRAQHWTVCGEDDVRQAKGADVQ